MSKEPIKKKSGGDSSKNIHQRINAVMEEITYIQKTTDVKMPKFSFKAVSHDKVIAEVRPSLIKHGIVMEATQKEIEVPFHTVPSSNPLQLYRAVYIVSFVNMDSPEDRVSVEIEAHSMCTDDKAPGKTYSYAVKLAILKQFCIETGESEESQYTPPTGQEIKIVTQQQAKELKTKANILGKSAKVLEALGVKMFEQIPAERYEWTLNHLNKQIQCQNKPQGEAAPL